MAADTSGADPGRTPSESGALPDPAIKGEQAPTFLCEFCGADKPAATVYSCTLCMMSFCTKHLNPAAHDCSFGAFGKPHSVGIGGSG